MPAPRELLWERQPHTAAKHRIYERYLDAWFPILLSRWNSVTYAEGFAGPGEYKHGKGGSPVLAARSAKRSSPGPRPDRPVRLLLVENDTGRAEHLRGRLRSELGVSDLRHALDVGFDVDVVTGRCEETLTGLISRHGGWNKPLLVILDTWGAAVSFTLLEQIARSRASEVIVTIEPQHFVRFASDPEHFGDRIFGPVVWRDVQAQPTSGKATYIQEQYRRVIQAAGFEHVLDFELADERTNLLYLVFGTNHERGVDKMKDAMWDVDPDRGVGYRDPRDPNQQLLAIEPTPQLGALRRLLTEQLEREPDHQTTIDRLRRFVLLGTIYKPSQTGAAIQDLLDRELVRRIPERGQLNKNTVIALAPQLALFPPDD